MKEAKGVEAEDKRKKSAVCQNDMLASFPPPGSGKSIAALSRHPLSFLCLALVFGKSVCVGGAYRSRRSSDRVVPFVVSHGAESESAGGVDFPTQAID